MMILGVKGLNRDGPRNRVWFSSISQRRLQDLVVRIVNTCMRNSTFWMHDITAQDVVSLVIRKHAARQLVPQVSKSKPSKPF